MLDVKQRHSSGKHHPGPAARDRLPARVGGIQR